MIEPTLVDRLGRLEREVRRWRLASVGAVLLAIAAASFGAAAKPATPRVVEANEFRVLNREGKTVARLLDFNGFPQLIVGGQGNHRAVVEAFDGGSRVSVMAPDGRDRASLGSGVAPYVSASNYFVVEPKQGDTRMRAVLKNDAVVLETVNAKGESQAVPLPR